MHSVSRIGIIHSQGPTLGDLGLSRGLGFVTSNGTAASSSSFTAFNYAGELSSGAFAYSATTGVFFTTNAVFPLAINASAPPRSFVQRSLIDTASTADALRALAEVKAAAGFSVNLGQVNRANARAAAAFDATLYNVETDGASGAQAVTPVGAGGVGYHVNMFAHLSNASAPQAVDASSVARWARLHALPAPMPDDEASLFRLLGDAADPVYPIWREGVAPDCCATMISALFHVIPPSAAGAAAASAGNAEVGVLSLYANNPLACAASDGPVLVRFF